MSPDFIAKSILMKAPVERVWAFLTEPDLMARWFHPTNRALTSTGPYHFFKNVQETEKPYCWGEVTAVEEGRRLEYTFAHDWLGGHATRVEWTLEPVEDGVRLSLRHDGFQDAQVDWFEALTDHDKGWHGYLADLREQVVEKAEEPA